MLIKSHRDLDVYKRAMDAAVAVHHLVRSFPAHERRNLGDQILRSSRSVCANLAEAWRKRRYIANFVSKLAEVQGEAAETQVWLEFANRVSYISNEAFTECFNAYEIIISQLAVMSKDAAKWTKRN